MRRIAAYFATRGMGRALRHRDYALYALVGWTSSIGFWVQRVAVGWLTWELTHSGAWLGAMVLAEGIPIMAFITIAGTLTDRVDRLFLARASQAAAMVIAVTLAILTFGGWINVYLLLALMVLNGVTDAFWTPVRMSMAPNLVPREDLSAALGTGSALFNLARVVGPALAGIIIVLAGVGWAFAFNAASFSIFFVTLFFIQLLSHEEIRRPGSSLFGELLEGVNYMRRDANFSKLLALMLATAFCLRPYAELMPGLADAVFGKGPEGLATLLSANGVGAVIASLYVANFTRIAGLTRLVFLILVAAAGVQVLFAATDTFWVAVMFSAGLGFAVTAGAVSAQILFQQAIPGDMRGRAMSIWGLVQRGGPALGTFLLGGLSTWWGLQAPLTAAAVVFAVAWILLFRHLGALAGFFEGDGGKN